MEPIVTPAEMGAVDAAAPEPVEVLIDRAGWATARAVLALLGLVAGRRYGARVLVLAGKGNNGADGRSAARFLAGAGVACRVEPPDFAPGAVLLSGTDFVVDAAYGTGFRGTYAAPDVGGVPVLAVDIPSGVDGQTGEVGGTPLAAAATVTFAAVKPGLLLHPGRALTGELTVADIGLDVLTGRTTWWIEEADLWPTAAPGAGSPGAVRLERTGPVSVPGAVRWERTGSGSAPGAVRWEGTGSGSVPGAVRWERTEAAGAVRRGRTGRPRVLLGEGQGWPVAGPTAHKWQRAVWVIGGHDTMRGAPSLASAGAARAGAGYVAVSVPGSSVSGPPLPVESVVRPLEADWGPEVVAQHRRFAALVVGPGLPTDLWTQAQVALVTAGTGDRGLVLDGGAIDAVAANPAVLRGRTVPAVLTPHDGELRRLIGRDPGPDRIATARQAAADLGAVVLSKGPTTVAAHPDGRVLVSTAGDQRLASAGTGDVLAGLVGAALAGGLEPLAAAALAAELHGRAARAGRWPGFVAGDLPGLVARYLDRSD